MPAPNAKRRYPVTGTVANSATGEPIRRALVHLEGRGEQRSSLTDAQGRFEVSDVVEGPIFIRAEKPGYFDPHAVPGSSYSSESDAKQVGRGTNFFKVSLIPEARLAGTMLPQVGPGERGPFLAGLLTVPEGASIQLSVAVSRGTAKLSGIAVKDGHPFSGAMILLVPQNGDPNIEMPRDQGDSDGTFTVQVHPGRYSLIAIENGRDLEYHNPAVLAPSLAHGRQVDFPSAVDTPIQVAVQPRK